MASWAKNQIAKQLAKFAKNVDPAQITLKFLKGEGELVNLELNEELLSQLLEFPPWLHLQKATCNRISAKVRWTSLKTDPIRLYLDCVEVEIVASEEIKERTAGNPFNFSKSQNAPNNTKAAPKPTKYGFVEKVVDGMFVSINTVMATFKSVGFKASFSMSRIIVQSTRPDWCVTDNLRYTRIKDDQRGQVLNFKEVKWGTLRIDADASSPESTHVTSTPLRLITNNSAIRITIKKRLADCSLVSSSLQVVLDDILWVLTQSQLLKLSSFVQYILKLRMKYLPLTPHTGDIERHATPKPTPAMEQQFQGKGQGSDLNPLFTKYDVTETSYHIMNRRIDLHLCDDQTLDGERANRKKNNGKSGKQGDPGGAIQVSFLNLRIDHCPYHIAGVKRNFIRQEDETSFTRRQWAHQLLEHFLKSEAKYRPDQSPKSGGAHGYSHKSQSRKMRPLMYENFFLVSCQYFDIMQVTTSGIRQPKPFLSSDKESLYLPEDMDAFFLDYTAYYHTGITHLLVPAPNIFVKVNPIKLTFHPETCIWLSHFAQNVVGGLEWTKEFFTRDFAPADHIDIRVEALLPKVIIPVDIPADTLYYDKRPKALQIQLAQAVISNSRIGAACSQSDLLMDLQYQLTSKLYTDLFTFPNKEEDIGILPNETWTNDYSLCHRQFQRHFDMLKRTKKCDLSIITHPETPRQIWCLWADQIWVEFLGIDDSNGRPITFVDAVPLRVWACVPLSFIGADQVALKGTDSDPASGDNDSTVSDLSRTFTPDNISGMTPNQPPQLATRNSVSTTIENSHYDKRKQLLDVDRASWPGQEIPDKVTEDMASNGLSENSRIPVNQGQVTPTSPAHSIPSNCSSRDSIDRAVDFELDGNGIQGQYLTLNGRRGSQSADGVSDCLRHSHSETSLLTRASPAKDHYADTQSLHEYRAGTSTFYDGAIEPPTSGPPPPYYPPGEGTSGSRLGGAPKEDNIQRPVRRLSDASLPPSYDVAYEVNLRSSLLRAHADENDIDPAVLSYFNSNHSNIHVLTNPASVPRIPTASIIVHVPRKTTIQLDHFQLIFLLRLGDMFQDFSDQISGDANQDSEKGASSAESLPGSNANGPCVTVNVSVPELEIDLMLPACEDVDPRLNETLLERLMKIERQKAKENERPSSFRSFTRADVTSKEVAESVVSSTSNKTKTQSHEQALGDGAVLTERGEGVAPCDKSNESMVGTSVPSKSRKNENKDLDDSSGISSSGSSPRTCPKCLGEAQKGAQCQCERERSKHRQQDSNRIEGKSNTGDCKSVNETTEKTAINFEDTSIHVSQENLGVLLDSYKETHHNADAATADGRSTMIESTSSFMDGNKPSDAARSATSSPELGIDVAAECSESWQTQTKSYDADDIDKKPLARLCSDVNHRPLQGVELDTQSQTAIESDSGKPCSSSSRRELEKYVSVVQIRAKNARIALEAEGDDSATKITVESIRLEEKGNVLYNRSLNHRLIFPEDRDDFTVSKKADVSSIGSENMISIRVEKGPKAEHYSPRSGELGFAQIRVNSLEASLKLSTTDLLAEFGEDEILSYTPPFFIQLEDLKLLLIDDKPRRLESAPVPVPVQICIEQLQVERSCEGIIQLVSKDQRAQSDPQNVSLVYERTGRELLVPSALATSSLPSMTDSLSSRIDELENENERLIEDLKVSNNRMCSLEDERDSLLKVIEKLQQELMWSNKENEELQTRLGIYKENVRGLNTLPDKHRMVKHSASSSKYV